MRPLAFVLVALAGSAAMAACSGEDVGQTEDQAVSCLWNGRGEHAMHARDFRSGRAARAPLPEGMSARTGG